MTREIMFVALEKEFKYIVTNYKVKVKGAMYNLRKWAVRVKILISKRHRRKCNMCNTV